MSSMLKPNQPLWDSLVSERDQWSGSVGWWYVSGYADAYAGYARDSYYNGGTVNYRGASPEEKEAYDQGYADGIGSAEVY
jgi:hypothetical protein